MNSTGIRILTLYLVVLGGITVGAYVGCSSSAPAAGPYQMGVETEGFYGAAVVKVSVAPRVVLIEKFSELVKGGGK